MFLVFAELFLPAPTRDQPRPQGHRPPVLGGHLCRGPMGAAADVGGVAEQALRPALHRQDELGDRGVGDDFEGGADAAVDGVDAADQVDLEAGRARSATRSGSWWLEERR